jgi:hydroxybutyrate-dimer hydrolase
VIEQGEVRWNLPNHSRPLIDYYTFLNIYAPCAVRAETLADAPFNTVPPALGDARCAALAERGLVVGASVAEQAADALARINAYGMIDEQNVLLPSHHAFFVFESIAVRYTYSYGRFSVSDNVCGYSYAFTDATTFGPVASNPTALATIFGTGNGIPPTGGISIVNDNSLGGSLLSRVSVSPTGALYVRRLATGVNEAGEPLTGAELAQHERVAEGAAAVQASGDLNGIPTIIVHGRADSVIPINYGARPSYGLNQAVEGAESNLRYSVMYTHLTEAAALPPSQVVPPPPRAPGEAPNTAEPITAANVPPIVAEPARANQIVYQAGDTLLRIGVFDRTYYAPIIGN